MTRESLKITYEDLEHRAVEDARDRGSAERRIEGPRRIGFFSHAGTTLGFLAAATVAIALVGWGLFLVFAALTSPRDTPLRIGDTLYVLSREAQRYLSIADVSPSASEASVLIIGEPHYEPSAQLALYRGLEILFRDNPELLQNTTFLAEGVPTGTTLSVDDLSNVNPHPDDAIIEAVLSSFLIPGYVAYAWVSQHDIPIIGTENQSLYGLSAGLWLDVEADQTPHGLLRWHCSVVARNKSMADTLINARRTHANPILFVGTLHMTRQEQTDFDQARASLGLAESVENLGIRDYLRDQSIGYTLLVPKGVYEGPDSEMRARARYARLFAAQRDGNYQGYIDAFLADRRGATGVTVAPAPAAAAQLVAALSADSNQSGKSGAGDEGDGEQRGNGKGGEKPPPKGNQDPPSGKGPTATDGTGKEQPKGLPKGDWEWHPDGQNRRGGTWVDKGTKRDSGSQPQASWDKNSAKPHWDLKDGRGDTTRFDEHGRRLTPGQAHGLDQ